MSFRTSMRSGFLPGNHMQNLLRYLFLLVLTISSLSGCASLPKNQVPEQVAPVLPPQELTDEELLNVSISVFKPGELPQKQKERMGLSQEIRDAEARFIPIHLKHTLQRTGYWGAVRVVPDYDVSAEIHINGTIEMSDGESVVLNIEVIDSRNVVWFRRIYAETARPEEHHGVEPEREDAFQDLFNTIANDIARYRDALSPEEIGEIRQIAALKYAQFMAPDSFDGYLAITPEGRLFIQRLPARDDPMQDRVSKIKVRDEMLVDTINDYYDIYYHDLWQPYADWRKFRQEEVSALRKLEREALAKQILGITAIVGAVALGAASDYETAVRTQPLQEVLIAGGAYSVYSGYQASQEGKINKDAIEELGLSFAAEAEPLVIQVEGQTVRLTGSAEQQYVTWRNLLKQLYTKETGLTPDLPQDQQSPDSSDSANHTQ